MAESPSGSFPLPEAADFRRDDRLRELTARVDTLLGAQGRLRNLLDANQRIVTQLELPTVLEEVVRAAVELANARYGALGIVGSHGNLEQFIHVGDPPGMLEAVGHLPHGEGLLGALIVDPQPIRLDRLRDDPRSIGFPPGHVEMTNFLGVPVRVGGTVYGHLYLTDHRGGGFSRDDEELVGSLAAAAGFAIENARLYRESQLRETWSAASAEMTSGVLTHIGEALPLVTRNLLALGEADIVMVVVRDESSGRTHPVHVVAADQSQEDWSSDRTVGSLATEVIDGGRARLFSPDDTGRPALRGCGPAMVVPLHTGNAGQGALIIGRASGRPEFTAVELEVASSYGVQAGVALQLKAARADREQVLLYEDRGRIARDLHDHIIQRLFGTGMQLQTVLGTMPNGPDAERVDQAITDLDDVIGQIRTIIFTLKEKAKPPGGIRQRLVDLLARSATRHRVDPRITLSGPLDSGIDAGLADDILAVAEELISNAVRHADATAIGVRIDADDREVRVEVSNEGPAFDADAPRSGLANLQRRASARGGDLAVSSHDGVTRALWTAPIGGRGAEATSADASTDPLPPSTGRDAR